MERDPTSEVKIHLKNAWAAHARGDDLEAEKLFRQALAIEPDSIETMYGLAIVLKAIGRIQEAIAQFEKIVYTVENREWKDRNRARMVRRLALGQINYLRDKDWNLEREVWQR
ncbi:MAG: hypothetical protein ANABAC_0371 [Anaerolineae bacterium]|jgi:tetratricopeptide (TPR) repeat protein|nr:MAG: hypothetical protein ANABAC_0371 [Anaerolineae bacterium]